MLIAKITICQNHNHNFWDTTLVACGGLISLAGALAMKPYPPQQGVPVNGVDE